MAPVDLSLIVVVEHVHVPPVAGKKVFSPKGVRSRHWVPDHPRAQRRPCVWSSQIPVLTVMPGQKKKKKSRRPARHRNAEAAAGRWVGGKLTSNLALLVIYGSTFDRLRVFPGSEAGQLVRESSVSPPTLRLVSAEFWADFWRIVAGEERRVSASSSPFPALGTMPSP